MEAFIQSLSGHGFGMKGSRGPEPSGLTEASLELCRPQVAFGAFVSLSCAPVHVSVPFRSTLFWILERAPWRICSSLRRIEGFRDEMDKSDETC
jgi:hypothetical protein